MKCYFHRCDSPREAVFQPAISEQCWLQFSHMNNQLILTHSKSGGAQELKIVLVFVFSSVFPSSAFNEAHKPTLRVVCSFVFACFCCNFRVPGHPLMIANFHLFFFYCLIHLHYTGVANSSFLSFTPEHGNVGKCLVQDDARWWESWSVFRAVNHCKWSAKTSLGMGRVCQIVVTSEGIAYNFFRLQWKYELMHLKLGKYELGWSLLRIPWGNILHVTAPFLCVAMCSVVTVPVKPCFTVQPTAFNHQFHSHSQLILGCRPKQL